MNYNHPMRKWTEWVCNFVNGSRKGCVMCRKLKGSVVGVRLGVGWICSHFRDDNVTRVICCCLFTIVSSLVAASSDEIQPPTSSSPSFYVPIWTKSPHKRIVVAIPGMQTTTSLFVQDLMLQHHLLTTEFIAWRLNSVDMALSSILWSL